MSQVPNAKQKPTARIYQENQLSAKFLGACSLNPFHIYDSSARLQMLSQHLGQMLVVDGAQPRALQTGMEREYGKYTYRVEMPVDGTVLAVIPRYMTGSMGYDTIDHNPQTVVLYEDERTKEVGMLNLTDYCTNHQYFGFKYKKTPAYNQLYPGARIAAGTVFLDSPSINDHGDYMFGVNANVAYMSHPCVADDGIGIRRGFLNKMGFRTYETRTMEWGRKTYALNLYGDEQRYKPFPDIGDKVRADGLLMAFRSNQPEELAIVEQSVQACRMVDFTFDDRVYANGAGGTVVDVIVDHDRAFANMAKVHMDGQAQKYDNARRTFYGEILRRYNELMYKSGGTLSISRPLHQLIVKAQSVISEGGKQQITKLHRNAPLDTYRVTIVIEYENLPNMGSKFTGLHGDKGVVCAIIEDEHMPVDQDGNQCDIIADGNSTINRANPGRLYEHYFNAARRDYLKRMCERLGVRPFDKEAHLMRQLSTKPAEQIQAEFDQLMQFYQIIAPTMLDWFKNGLIQCSQMEYLAQVIHCGNGLHVPTDHSYYADEVVLALENDPRFRPTHGKVTYTDYAGNRVTTVDDVRIAEQYVIMLEKIGDDWSAVSSSKMHLMGVPSQITKGDKYAQPMHAQPVRVQGEGEIRLMLANCGERFTAEVTDINNNPAAHQAMVDGLYRAEKPTNIERLVDREIIPYGGHKALQMLNHLLKVSGLQLRYKPYSRNKNIDTQATYHPQAQTLK